MASSGTQSLSTQLDHIIILLSPTDFQTIPSWLSDNFTIYSGGTHSKGTSHNKLILFQDGTYLELFSWVDPQPAGVEPYADFPSWASKPEGHIIDWALTGDDAHAKHRDVTTTLQGPEMQSLRVTYEAPKEGGRKRKDGEELSWYATRSQPTGSGDLEPISPPFFCHDISPRTLRVPYTQGSIENWPAITIHPCGATGVADVTVSVPEARFEPCARLFESLLCTKRHNSRGGDVCYLVPSPQRAGLKGGADGDLPGPGLCTVMLQPMSGDLGGTAVQALSLWTNKENRKGEAVGGSGLYTPILLQ